MISSAAFSISSRRALMMSACLSFAATPAFAQDDQLVEEVVVTGSRIKRQDYTSISPLVTREIAQRLRERGIEMLDAPVSGGEVGAKEATLSIMVGGNEKAFERAGPIFKVMGKNIVHIGEAGAGQVTKACNQIIVGMTIQAVSEAMTIAKKSGVDLAKARSALRSRSPLLVNPMSSSVSSLLLRTRIAYGETDRLI